MSKDAIEALDYANKNHDSIEWIALDAFRVWYMKKGSDALEIVCKEFNVSEA